MKRAAIICVLMIGSFLWAGNSIFSYDGFPIQYYGRDIYSMGMGDTGASDVFRFNSGYANPAQRNRSNKTIFGTGILLGYTSYKSEYQGQKRSYRDDSLDFSYFSVSVPIKQHRLGFQFNPFANGMVSNQIHLDENTTEYQETDKYIYRADLIYSYNFKNLSLGISGNYYFGHDNRTFEQFSEEATVPTTESLRRNFKNPTMSFGAIQRFHDHALGLHVTLPVTLEGESERSSFHSSEDAVDFKYKLPMLLGLSYTGIFNKEFKVATDFNYESYSEISNELRDSWKLGIGLAWEPEKDRKNHWWQRIPLRAGYSLRELSFPSGGEYVEENTFSAGCSIALKNDINRLDMGIQYQLRGSLDSNQLQDRSFMLMLGFTGFDIITKAPDRTAPREIPEAEDTKLW